MTSTNRSSPFARNVIANWTAFLFIAVVSFFLAPFVVNNLGNEAYGVWVLMGTLVGYLGLLDFGVRGAVTRYIARHHAAKETEESSRVLSAGIVLFGSFGLLAVLFAIVVSLIAPFLFNVPESLVSQMRIVIFLGGVNVAVALIGGVFGGVIAGLQRYDVSSGIEILATTIRASATVLALNMGYGLVALALIQLLSSLLAGGIDWLASHKLYPQLRLRFRDRLRPNMRKLLSFGVYSSLIQISGMLIYYTDSVVIAATLPIGLVTFYAIAAALCDYARTVVTSISTIMTPRVSAMHASGGEAVEQAVLGAAKIATLAVAPIVATFLWRGESFINLWMGPDYGARSAEVLRLLAVVVWLGGARSVAVATIMGVNQHRRIVPALIVEALSNLALSIALVGVLGLVGVALGALIPGLIVTLGVLPRILRSTNDIRVGVFYRDAWVLPSMACVPFAVATALVELYFPADNLAIFFLQVAMLLPLVPLAAVAICLTPSEKEYVFSSMRRLTGRAG